MAKQATGSRLMIVLALAVLVGALVGAFAGTRIGIGVGVVAALIGAVAVTLFRNQRDLRELEQGRVPSPVNEALGEPPPD